MKVLSVYRCVVIFYVGRCCVWMEIYITRNRMQNPIIKIINRVCDSPDDGPSGCEVRK
jgi:hypothetical protein